MKLTNLQFAAFQGESICATLQFLSGDPVTPLPIGWTTGGAGYPVPAITDVILTDVADNGLANYTVLDSNAEVFEGLLNQPLVIDYYDNTKLVWWILNGLPLGKYTILFNIDTTASTSLPDVNPFMVRKKTFQYQLTVSSITQPA
jgi:hypothetical protein